MSEQACLDAFAALVQASPLSFPANAVYTDIPAFPLRGSGYPFLIIQPGTQTSDRITNGMIQQHGFYTLIYFDTTGAESGLTIGQIMSAARAFAAQLRQVIRTDPTLGGRVMWAGEGRGIIVRYSDAGTLTDIDDTPLHYIPVDVDTLDYPEPAGPY